MAALKTHLILAIFSGGLVFTACSKAPPVATAYKESGDFQAAETDNTQTPDDGTDQDAGNGGDGNAAAAQFASDFYASNSCAGCHPSLSNLSELGPYDSSTVASGADVAAHAAFAADWPAADTDEAQALADLINEEFPPAAE